MNPQVIFRNGVIIELMGELYIKRTYFRPPPDVENNIYLCFKNQKVKGDLKNLIGQEISSIKADDNGNVHERTVFTTGQSLVPIQGETFLLKGIETER